MRSGFRKELRELLLKDGLGTENLIGTTLSKGSNLQKIVRALGFPVERGINKPTYDYIIIGESEATSKNVAKAWNALVVGGTLLVRTGGTWHHFVIRKGSQFIRKDV